VHRIGRTGRAGKTGTADSTASRKQGIAPARVSICMSHEQMLKGQAASCTGHLPLSLVYSSLMCMHQF
jgi:superfamily II DNA/RNA helicase